MKKYTILFLLIGSQLLQAQVVANPPNPLIVCEINSDGFAEFDLTSAEAQIIGSQDPSMIQITYHLNQIEAQNGTNVIVNPTSYYNTSNPQLIYVRVESIVNGDFAVTALELIVGSLPVANLPVPYELCDDAASGSTTDQISIFDLSTKENEITGGVPGVTVTWYLTPADEQADIEIPTPEAFANTITPQTMVARVTDEFGCSSTTTLTLVVLPNPTPSIPNPLVQIDTDGDGVEVFDLTLVSDEVLNGEPNVSLSFYITLSDADSNTNPIANQTAFHSITTTLFIRVESQLTGCYTIVPLMLVVDNIPDVPSDIDDFVVYDENGDGVAEFNLNLMIPQLIGSQTGLEVSFYETEDDAQNKSNVIEEPEVYENISNPQTIYARTETIYGTYALTVFNIFADENLNTTSFELNQIRLYPNPAGDFMNVHVPETYKNLNIEVVNLNGKLLLSNNFTNRTSEAVIINLSSLTPGIYFLKINSDDTIITKKLVKK